MNTTTATSPSRTPVTLVCVYNDRTVLTHCLLRSVEAGRASAPETEVVAVDNRLHRFSSAGAALNHGARSARNEVVVFVHQDVYLHSLVKLEEAAARLAAGEVHLAGAAGITSAGRLAGRIRDRVVLAGDRADEPIDVDSLDEVLFATTRARVLADPLSEHPDLSWHAYAVEYGLRVRRTGGRVAAVDVPLTHNSLSTNMARLSEAHGAVGAMYPEHAPFRTTCGVVGGRRLLLPQAVESQRWRYHRLKNSRRTVEAHRLTGKRPVLFTDLRESVDRLLAVSPDEAALVVLNAVPDGAADGWDKRTDVELARRERTVAVAAVARTELQERLSDPLGRSVLVTNLSAAAAICLYDRAPGHATLGYTGGTGHWLLVGPLARAAPLVFDDPRHRPFDLHDLGPRSWSRRTLRADRPSVSTGHDVSAMWP